MRKLRSNEKKDLKNKRNTVMMGILMLVLLLASTAGYAIVNRVSDSNNSEELSESAEKVGNYWVFEYSGQDIYLRNSPEEVRNISVMISPMTNINTYSSKVVYVDSGNEGVYREIAANIGRFSSRTQRACYTNCTEDFPEKDCSSNLIIWEEGDYNSVTQNENCIFIKGDLRSVDAFIYKIFGIN